MGSSKDRGRTRHGLWVDDDQEFTTEIRKSFKRFENYRLETINNPYAVDWFVRTRKPDFVVFDLRWKETANCQWYGDEKIGIKLIKQVQSAFPNENIVLGFVVSDLASMGGFRRELEDIPLVRHTFDKREYKNLQVLCKGIVDNVEHDIGALRSNRGRYFEWSSVCSCLSGSSLRFVDSQICQDEKLKDVQSPAEWKRRLDALFEEVHQVSEQLLQDWYGNSKQKQKKLTTTLERLFEFGHSKTPDHGKFIYMLHNQMVNTLIELGGLSEPQGIAIDKVIRYLSQNEKLSQIELQDIIKSLATLTPPKKVYNAVINRIHGGKVFLHFRRSSGEPVEGQLPMSEFPNRELWEGMEVVLEIREIANDVTVVPHVLTPSLIMGKKSNLPRSPIVKHKIGG